jgi:hypothetical protein
MSKLAVEGLKKFGIYRPSDGLIREVDKYISSNPKGKLLNNKRMEEIIAKVVRYNFRNMKRTGKNGFT